MSLRDAWNDGLDWAGEKLEDVKEYATDKAISIGTGIVMDNYKKSITDALGGPSKMTPELAAAGWKPGLDGVQCCTNQKQARFWTFQHCCPHKCMRDEKSI